MVIRLCGYKVIRLLGYESASLMVKGCGGSWTYNASGVEYSYLFDNPRVITRG